MILPTRRTFVALLAVAPVGLLGFLSPVALDVMLLFDLLIVGGGVVDAMLAPAPGAIRVTREAPGSLSVGRATAFVYRWTNLAGRTARLIVRETRPGVVGGVLPARSLAAAAGETVTERQVAVPARRGRESGGWFAVRSVGPLSLGQRQDTVELPWDVTVYPSLPTARLRASLVEAVRHRELGLRRARRLGEGSQFESLREWVPGDDPRHIDWKASARHAKLIARQFEEERRQRIMLVLDAGRLLTAEVDGEPRMEHVIRAALWLGLAAYRQDDDIGIMVMADRVLHYAAPQGGRRGLSQVLDVLAVAEPRLVETDYPGAFRYLAVRNRKRALTIFFTDAIDRFASRALVSRVGALRPRHLPLVVTLRNPDLERIAGGRPATLAEAYRKAAAEELMSARDDALAMMRRAGAKVLDVNPGVLSVAVVEKYLELKRRGRV